MLPSQLAAGIDKLLAVFTAALPAMVQIADGLQVRSDYAGDWAVVGGDGVIGEEEDAGHASSTWNGLGAKVRNEALDIVCAIGSSTGNDEQGMKARRDQVWAYLTLVEAALRTDPGLTGFTTGGGAAVTEVTLKYPANVQGLGAVAVFTINIPVRI